MRVTMKVAANAVKAGQIVHPRAAKRSDAKAVIAPKPKLLNARPTPGRDTAEITVVKGARTVAEPCPLRSAYTELRYQLRRRLIRWHNTHAVVHGIQQCNEKTLLI